MLRLPAFVVALLSVALFADDRLVVDDEAFEQRATDAATVLHEKGKLVSLEKLRGQLKRTHCKLALPEPCKAKLRPPEVYRLIRNSTVAVATFYKCSKCKKWHFESASGFVAADGVVSTCEHVVDFEDEDMKDGYLVVADAKGRVFPITEVLASSVDSDTCLLRVPGLDLPPLPLSHTAQVGDPVFCLSHPDGNHWMFTAGMLSRFFINREPATDGDKPPPKAKLAPSLYINVTAEYSPGSSGAPVVDECGNVVGQVESITSSIEDQKGDDGKNVTTSFGMPLRSCVASEEIARLTRAPAKRGK
ncbi:MAG: serine protease [Chthoniobacteraceae bacterium]